MKKDYLLYWFLQIISWRGFCGLLGIGTFVGGGFTLSTVLHLIKLFILLILFSHGICWIILRYDWLKYKIGILIPRALILVVIWAFTLLFVNSIRTLIGIDTRKAKATVITLSNLLRSTLLFR